MPDMTDRKRRALLAGLAASIAGGAIPARAGAQQGQMLDLDGPFAAMELYARIRGSNDGRPSAWYSQSIYYGQLDHEAPVPILGSEGLNLVSLRFEGRARLVETTERVMYHTDLDTGQPLTRWHNVFTDETIPLVQAADHDAHRHR